MTSQTRTLVGIAFFLFAAALAGMGGVLLMRGLHRKQQGRRHEAQSLLMGAFALFVGGYIVLRVAIGVVREG